jgi:methylenetetrahydrofolate dehydrogenase (NADP+) / methenyltetrahydrofolate cyclohydrolase
MTAKILDGKALAAAMKGEIAADVEEFKTKHGFAPAIAVVRAGEDPASVSYANQIQKAFTAAGMGFALHLLPATASQAKIEALVRKLSRDKSVHGIMVQEPLPKGIDEEAVKANIVASKDVDGVTPVSMGLLTGGVGEFFAPATPSGGMEMLKRSGIELKGKRAVVIGRSSIVGKPMAMLMLHQHATVTICHSRTVDLPAVAREADILVAAIGRGKLVGADFVKPGAVLVDFGVNFIDGKMVGDIDIEAVKEIAGAITPVPGGTGPMTNVMLMKNVIAAAKRLAA